MPSHVQNKFDLEPETRAFYCQSLTILNEASVRFLIGGAFAFERYTGIARNTKDLDLFVHPRDIKRILEVFSKAGYDTELTAPHWLGKAFCGDKFVDLIFSGANGYAEVDDLWFEYAVADEVLGIPVLVCPPEETIWSKSFVMARDRFDGADIAHLILACGTNLDWSRLLDRFGDRWRVLYSHLIMFGFIYPGESDRIPTWVMNKLCDRLQQETNSPPMVEKLCQGTLLDSMHYRIDVERWGYKDARVRPFGNLTATEIDLWIDHLKQENAADSQK